MIPFHVSLDVPIQPRRLTSPLIDLLIEHFIGVRKRAHEVLAVDPDAFADLEGDA